MAKRKPLSDRDQAVLEEFKNSKTPIIGLVAVTQAAERSPILFPRGPLQKNEVAALMSALYRRVKALHRQKSEGEGRTAYEYFYDETLSTKRVIEGRRQRRNPNQAELFETPAKAVKVKAARAARRKNRQSDMSGGEYLIVKTADGRNAGVLRNGILYNTLESLVGALNAKLVKS